MRAGRICDECSAPEQGKVYPAGWLHVQVNGRRFGTPNAERLGSADLCSKKCAEAYFRKHYWPAVTE